MARSAEDIKIGELSRQTGCNVETIRYYERVGLLPRRLAAPRDIGFMTSVTFAAWFSCAGRANWVSRSMKSAHCWASPTMTGKTLAPKYASLRLVTSRMFGRRLPISVLWRVC